jgi:hypothetical protein
MAELLRLHKDLQAKTGQQYCAASDLVALLLAYGLCKRVDTFQVEVQGLSDQSAVHVTLESETATGLLVKQGVELQRGILVAAQELYHFDKNWKPSDKEISISNDDGNSSALVTNDETVDGPCTFTLCVKNVAIWDEHWKGRHITLLGAGALACGYIPPPNSLPGTKPGQAVRSLQPLPTSVGL